MSTSYNPASDHSEILSSPPKIRWNLRSADDQERVPMGFPPYDNKASPFYNEKFCKVLSSRSLLAVGEQKVLRTPSS